MRKPLVLVVMPLYNAVQYVQKAVDSILNQTFKEFQLLIIDDGSTDGSYELVQGIKDPRVTVWKQENMGLCPTLNKGLRYAHENRIPYTARMDADDLSEPTRLEKQLALLEALPEKAACSSNCYYIDENDQIIGSSTVPLSPRLIRWEVQQGLRGMIHGATLFRTEALFSIDGYRVKFRFAEDMDIFLRLSEKYDLVNCKDYLYKIRIISSSFSVKNIKMNCMYQFYALHCAERRRRGKPEVSFEEFAEHMGFRYKFRYLRELAVLHLWRMGMTRKSKLPILMAILLDPRRLIARLLRYFERSSGWSARKEMFR